MQVFIISTPLETAMALDPLRRNKQLLETQQILDALNGKKYAKQCDSKADFKRKYQAGYKYAREHKLFDILKWRMEKLY